MGEGDLAQGRRPETREVRPVTDAAVGYGPATHTACPVPSGMSAEGGRAP
jgi:hypothetical protein